MKGRKMNAFEMNSMFSSMPINTLNQQAEKLLIEGKEYLIHSIGLISLFKMNGIILSVNRESLLMKFFDTEQEAIDFYLDKYQSTKEFKQQNLFNP